MLSFMTQPLYAWRKSLQYPLNWKLGGLHTASLDMVAKRKKSLPLLGIET